MLLYAGHPPIGAGWLGFVALVPLLVLARDVAGAPRPLRAGFGWGTAAGLVSFGLLVSWVGEIDPAGLVLLPAYLALWVGAYVAGLAAWGQRPGRAAVAVLWWVALEALRGAVPYGGFTWGTLGYTQASGGMALPVARVLGVLGVSAVLAAAAVALEAVGRRGLRAWRRRAAGQPPGEVAFAAARAPLAAFVGLLAVPVLLTGTAPVGDGRTLDVAGVQGFDVEGSTGRSLPRAVEIGRKMLEATETMVADGGVPELTVWPENAVDGDPRQREELAEQIADGTALLGSAPLLAGMIWQGEEPDTWENVIGHFEDGELLDRYVKRQPVPFGEYIPLRPLIGWYPAIERMRPTDAVQGTDPGVFDVAGTRVGVVICFESTFPRLVDSQVDLGAELLVVATNNSSFGRTALSDQHLAFSRMRAVETGRWVVHSALSGISALIDPDGVVHQRTGLFEQDVIRADVPLVQERTLATRLGQVPGWTAVGLSALAFAWLGLTRGRSRRMAAPDPPR